MSWISVKDRLSKDDKPYLVAGKRKVIAAYGFYKDGFWYLIGLGKNGAPLMVIDTIGYWMKPPMPPVDVKKE